MGQGVVRPRKTQVWKGRILLRVRKILQVKNKAAGDLRLRWRMASVSDKILAFDLALLAFVVVVVLACQT